VSDLPWWEASEGEAHGDVFRYVRAVDNDQSDIFTRLYRYGCLYDQYDRLYEAVSWETSSVNPEGVVDENIVKPAVDTATSIVARMRPRVRCQTDGAEWSVQRRARRLESYIEGLFKKTRIFETAPSVFRDACVFGLGVMKVYPQGKKIVCERVVWDEIVVDEQECRSAPPRHLHQRKLVDRQALLAKYPEKGEEIGKAGATSGSSPYWAGWSTRSTRPGRDDVVVIESWRLKTDDSPGRHTICVDGGTLLDEEWTHDWFPFVTYQWSPRVTGFYGRGVVEDIAEHQRQARRLSWMIDRILHQIAVPRAFVHVADAAMGVKLDNQIGAIVTYKVKPPEIRTPTNLIGEHYDRLERIKQSAFEVVGISRLSAQALKPAGLESAVALREYNDLETQRFAIQAQSYERMFVDAARLMVAWAKEMAGDAPVVWERGRESARQIEWSEVDLDDVPYSLDLDAASALSRTPAGRQQAVIEWSQAGLISTDEARKLLAHPDLKSAMSLYNAAIEDIDATIEDLLDGESVVPEPFQNLTMGMWRMQTRYLDVRREGAPEDVLEGMRTWWTQAQWLLEQSQKEQQVLMGMGQPMATQPEAALAAPAMSIAPVG
jgi:hypothetical protein